MDRPLLIAAFVLLLVVTPLSAQHGGGHASFGGHGGFSAHSSFSGHLGSARPSSGMRSSGFASASRGYSRRAFGARGYSNFRGSRFRNYGFRNNCYGYSCRGAYGYPWGYAGAFDPYWWWDSGSSYDQDQQNQIDMANQMNAQSLDEQRMREQDNQYVYQHSAPAPPRAARGADPEVVPDTVLVFRDQHKEEVQNYAIVGQTLWNFAAQRTQKIPLSDLDLPATTKANDERGVDFRIPTAHEGQ